MRRRTRPARPDSRHVAAMTIVALLAGADVRASNPTITAITPNSVGIEGGSVTVTGTDFAQDAVVKISSYACADVKVVSPTRLTCTAPRNIARKANVTLSNGDGGTAALPA